MAGGPMSFENLSAFFYMDGTLSVAELAEKIGVKFEKAKVFIDKMAEHGLVKKNKSEFDKIVKRIERWLT